MGQWVWPLLRALLTSTELIHCWYEVPKWLSRGVLWGWGRGQRMLQNTSMIIITLQSGSCHCPQFTDEEAKFIQAF